SQESGNHRYRSLTESRQDRPHSPPQPSEPVPPLSPPDRSRLHRGRPHAVHGYRSVRQSIGPRWPPSARDRDWSPRWPAHTIQSPRSEPSFRRILRRLGLREAFFDIALNELVNTILCQSLRPTNGILDCLGRRTAMADHGNPVHTEKRCPAE